MGQCILKLLAVFLVLTSTLYAHKTRNTPDEKARLFQVFEKQLANDGFVPDEISTLEEIKSGTLVYKGMMNEPCLRMICQMYWLKKLTLQTDLTPDLLRVLNETERVVEKGKHRGQGLHNLRSLTHITLKNCGLKTLPHFLWTLDRLVFLDLSYNKLTQNSFRAGAFSKLKKLKVLYLNHNAFTQLPSFCNDAKRLEVLNVSDNAIKDLPAALWNLKNLQRLSLRGTDRRTLPKTLTNLVSLLSLDLRDNQKLFLTPEQHAFLADKNVKDEDTPYTGQFRSNPQPGEEKIDFYARNQSISAFLAFYRPRETEKIQSELSEGKLVYQGIVSETFLTHLNAMPWLTSLTIIATNEEAVHLDLFQNLCPNTTFLSLSAAKIHYRNHSLGHMNLKTLKLQGALRIVPLFVKKQQDLKVLDLSNNTLIDLPPWLCDQVLNLKRIDMHNNFLKHLPGAFENLEHLEKANFSHNAFRFKPRTLERMEKNGLDLTFINERNIAQHQTSPREHTAKRKKPMPTSRSVHRGLNQRKNLFEVE